MQVAKNKKQEYKPNTIQIANWRHFSPKYGGYLVEKKPARVRYYSSKKVHDIQKSESLDGPGEQRSGRCLQEIYLIKHLASNIFMQSVK